jgi:hypothetical protein
MAVPRLRDLVPVAWDVPLHVHHRPAGMVRRQLAVLAADGDRAASDLDQQPVRVSHESILRSLLLAALYHAPVPGEPLRERARLLGLLPYAHVFLRGAAVAVVATQQARSV